MPKQCVSELKQGLDAVKAAIQTRQEITALYEQYRSLQAAANQTAQISNGDFKLAVDALHYLGGGWPSENSKGRMERLLDNFAGMYCVLDFIGKGSLVTEHLSRLGITVNLHKDFAIQNVALTPNEVAYLKREYNIGFYGLDNPKDLRELITGLVLAGEMLQGDICQKADQIKDHLKPAALSKLGVVDEEYDRIRDILRFSIGESARPKKAESVRADTAESVSNYNRALGLLSEVTNQVSSSRRP